MFKPFEITSTGLSAEVIKQIVGCGQKYSQINKIVLFGSRAMGTYRQGSDIDICLIGHSLDQNIGLKLASDLDELNLPYTFDIAIYHKIENSEFVEHINRVGMELPIGL